MAVVDVNFFSECLSRTVTFRAILPFDKYAAPWIERERGPEKYKTLYLLHGMHGNYTDWVNGSRVERWAIDRDLVVIMPSGENHFYVDNPATGQFYGKFISEELIWFTRRMFPLSERREDTYIAGLSMGGYGALVNGLKYHDTFCAIGAFSAGLILDRVFPATEEPAPGNLPKGYYEMVFGDLDHLSGSDKDYYALVAKLLKEGHDLPALYMAVGQQDGLYKANVAFKDFLRENRVPVTFEEGPGRHGWDFWDTYLLRFFTWLFPDYREPEWREVM